MAMSALELEMSMSLARLQTDTGKAVRIVENMANKFSSVLGNLGIGLGAGAFVSLISGSINAMDRLRDVSKTTGMVEADLAGLQLLANQTGTNFDSLAKGINKMSVEMGKSPEKFKALGITATDSKEAFKQFADIFKLLPDIAQRNALAQAAFGKTWQELAPALSEGSKKIGETIETGARLSGVTSEMTKKADEFNDRLAEISMASKGVVTQISAGMLPALQALADNFNLVKGVVFSVVAAKLAGWIAEGTAEMYKNIVATNARNVAVIASAQADVVAKQAAMALAAARWAEQQASMAAAKTEIDLSLASMGAAANQARATAATVAHTASVANLAKVQAGASVTAGYAGKAIGLLGGPIGAITLLLGLGATAWSIWGNKAEEAATQAEESLRRGLDAAKRINDESRFGSGDTGTLKKAMGEASRVLETEMQNMRDAQAAVRSNSRASAESIARDLKQVEQSYGKSVAAARQNVELLGGALVKAQNPAGMTDEQRRAAARAAAFIGGEGGKKKGDTDEEIYNAKAKVVEDFNKRVLATVKEQHSREKQLLDAALDDKKVSIDNYWKQVGALEQQSYEVEKRQLQDMLVIAEDFRAKKKHGSVDYINATKQVIDVTFDLMKLERDRAAQNLANERAIIKAKEQYANMVKDIEVQLLELQGKSVEAQRMRMEMSQREARLQAAANGDTGTLKKLDEIARLTDLQSQMNKQMEDYQLITGRLKLEEEQIARTRETGAITELEALRKTGDARTAAVEKMEEMVRNYERMAAADGTPKMKLQAEQLREELEKLKGETDLIAKKWETTFTDAFTDAFTSFVEGTKSAKDAFKDFANSILREINKMAAEQIKNAILGKNTTSIGGNGGGLLSSLANGIMGMFGGGPSMDWSAATAGATNWVDSYAVGSKYVPRTGLAMLHKGESVMTAAETRNGGGSGMTVNAYNTFVLDNPASKQTQSQVATSAGLAMERQLRRFK